MTKFGLLFQGSGPLDGSTCLLHETKDGWRVTQLVDAEIPFATLPPTSACVVSSHAENGEQRYEQVCACSFFKPGTTARHNTYDAVMSIIASVPSEQIGEIVARLVEAGG